MSNFRCGCSRIRIALSTWISEDVRIADRSLHPGLEALAEDFALFDAETRDVTVVLFDYDERGRVRSYRVANDSETVARCRDQYALALGASVPLAQFMTERLHR